MIRLTITTQIRTASAKGKQFAPVRPALLALVLVAGFAAAAPAAALAAPSVATNPATKVHHTSAVLNGHLDPDTDPGITTCSFEWGTTVAYGNTAPCSEGNAFSAPADVSANVNNLTPGTTYHFRLHVETTSSGPSDGADESFRPNTFPITHPEIASFGPDGTPSTSFVESQALAFNQSTRELFALDRKASAIFGFDASSPPSYAPLAGFNPLGIPGPPGEQMDIAVDSTSLSSAGNVYYVAANNFVAPPEPPEYNIYGYDSSGSPLAGFPIQTTPGVRSCGAAVDSAGHLWVAEHTEKSSTIVEFSSTGTKLASINTFPPGYSCRLAFDSNDDMYVVSNAGAGDAVWKYTVASGYASSSKIAPRSNYSVAVDTSTHNVYTSHYVEESEGYPRGERVYQYDSSGHFLGDFAFGVDVNRVAVDPTNHHVFVSSGSKIRVFDPTVSTTVKLPTVTTGKASAITGTSATISGAVDPEGLSVVDCHIGWGEISRNDDTYEHNVPCSVGSGSGDVPVSTNITGLKVGTEYHFRVFASSADGMNAGKDVSFTTNFPPSVAVSAATNITSNAADLNGLVNPKGFATSYHFEWGPTPAYGNNVPVPDGNAGAGNGNTPVSAHISGLDSNTRYYWRLTAQNINGSAVIDGDSFLTLGGTVVETTGAPLRTTTSAQLGGRVAPRGFATDYFFEYGTEGPCDANSCTATATRSAGSGASIELVSEQIEGLEPTTTYHYRVVAESGQANSPVYGNDMTVTTLASEAPLSHGHFPGPPDSDRAYEQVTPPDTGGNPVNLVSGLSADGNRALYYISGGTPLSEEGNVWSVYFSQRNETGPHEGFWQARSIVPPRNNEIGNPHWYVTGDADLSTIPGMFKNEGTQKSSLWRLDPTEPAIHLGDGSGAASDEIDLGGAGVSDDGSRLMAILRGPRDPEYPSSGENLYDLSSGTPHLASLLPNGTACAVRVKNPETPFVSWRHAISADGSMAFFESKDGCGGVPSRVYMRDLLASETKLVSPAPLSGPECDANFLSSTPGAAFFWSRSRLSPEDTAPDGCGQVPLDGDVYRYDFGDETLKCVTCVIAGVDADVFVPFSNGNWRTDENLLVAEDGSRIYFQSPRALVPGAPSVPVGEPGNFYRVNVNSGDLAWVGSLTRGTPPTSGLGALQSPATPDGSTLLLYSDSSFLNPLNGTDNAGTAQIYRYDDRDRSFACVSCPNDGSAPRGAASSLLTGGHLGATSLSEDGETIAFPTPTPLVGADQNTAGPGGSAQNGIDIYEWRDGRYLLVTDGLTNSTPGTEGPALAGMSNDGHDIFFVAPTQYTPDAVDGYRRLYDARIGGGFLYPTPTPPCPLEVCQGTPNGAPEERAPGTGTFAGPGNLSEPARAKCAKGKARRKGRCVAKKPKRAHKASHKRANHNRGTAR